MLAEAFHGPRKQVAVLERRYKLVADLDVGVHALYDHQADPQETRNLAAVRPAELQRMQRRMLELRRALEPLP